MSAEWLTATATAGTFVVIAASAIAALLQLRHMRGGNQIAVVTELRETMETPEFASALRALQTLSARLNGDPRLRKYVMTEPTLAALEEFRPAIFIGNYFETAGSLVRHGIVDGDLFCDMWAAVAIGAWDRMEELIANRRVFAGPGLYENFEYVVVLSERWVAKYRNGTFPRNMERKQLPAPWPEGAQPVDA